jgi:hypothetical protein
VYLLGGRRDRASSRRASPIHGSADDMTKSRLAEDLQGSRRSGPWLVDWLVYPRTCVCVP